MYHHTDNDYRHSGGGGAYTALGAIFFITALLVGAFIGIGAIAGALVLIGLTRLLSGVSLSFKQAYKVAFWSFAAWLAVSYVIISTSEELAYVFAGGRVLWDQLSGASLLYVLAFVLPVHLPGICACATVIKKKLPREFEGVAGFVLAALVSVVAVACGLALSALIFLAAIHWISEANTGAGLNFVRPPLQEAHFAGEFLMLWGAAFCFTVIGALIAGVVLMGYAMVQRNRISYRRAYGAAVLALLFWAVITVIIEINLRTVSPFIKWLLGTIQNPQQLVADMSIGAQFTDMLIAFLLSQVPGLLAAANFVSGQIHPEKPGLVSYACAFIAGAVATNIAVVATVAGLAWMSGGSLAINP